MPRHCKNANSNMFLTANERKKNAYGSLKVKYGSDYAKPFDSCSICLHRVVNPVSCDQGHIFCKECIMNYILDKKADYEMNMKEYELSIAKKQLEEKEKKNEDTLKILNTIDTNTSNLTNSHIYKTQVLSKEEQDLEEQKRIIEKFSSNEDLRTEEEKKLHALFSETDPEYTAAVKKPSSTIFCPSAEHPIKYKDMIAIHFVEHEENGKKEFYCPSCLKAYSFQKIMLIKQCGHTICYNCFKQFVSSSKQCFTCSNPVTKKKDFLQLQSGETAFSAHNKIEATSYRPGKN